MKEIVLTQGKNHTIFILMYVSAFFTYHSVYAKVFFLSHVRISQKVCVTHNM